MSAQIPPIPDYYQSGARLSLQIDDFPRPLRVEVLHPITPFSMCQVIVVRASSGTILPFLPLNQPDMPFVVKVFDPRFTGHRFRNPPKPWDLYTEKAVQAQNHLQIGCDDYPPDPERPSEADDSFGWENYYYWRAMQRWHIEYTAYKRLVHLQGTSIPRYFGKGNLIGLTGRAIVPRLILLEFIPNAKTLKEVDGRKVDPSVPRSLINAARQLGEFGVIHQDLGYGNILFSPGDCPARGVIIDFSEADYREENDDDKEWREIVSYASDYRAMKHRMKEYLGFFG